MVLNKSGSPKSGDAVRLKNAGMDAYMAEAGLTPITGGLENRKRVE
jgi:hypothetical protein